MELIEHEYFRWVQFGGKTTLNGDVLSDSWYRRYIWTNNVVLRGVQGQSGALCAAAGLWMSLCTKTERSSIISRSYCLLCNLLWWLLITDTDRSFELSVTEQNRTEQNRCWRRKQCVGPVCCLFVAAQFSPCLTVCVSSLPPPRLTAPPAAMSPSGVSSPAANRFPSSPGSLINPVSPAHIVPSAH